MIQTILYLMTATTAIVFLQMNHPLAMGLMLLVQTTLICLITGMLAKSFWFSYILFLVFLGGMLVLFIYVTSLASNEMFSLSPKMTLLCVVLFSTLTMMSLICDKTLLYSFFNNNEMMAIPNLSSYLKENTLNLIKLYNFPNNLITTMLINYLLISLVAIVKITNIFYGPLRPMT